MKKLFILVGVPGSGKSFKAKEIAEHYTKNNIASLICSTDDEFIVNGAYQFDQKKLGENHTKCQKKAESAMRYGICVIVDNTNILKVHREPYKNLAAKYGYEVEEVFIECDIEVAIKRNTHNVPEATIRRMASQIER